jgi:hypothetical protein
MDCLVNVNAIPGCVVESVENSGEVEAEGKNRSVMSIPVKESDRSGEKVCAMWRSHSPVKSQSYIVSGPLRPEVG